MISKQKSRILVLGMSPRVGGVERYIITLLHNLDRGSFSIDFLIREDITGKNAEDIKGYYENIYKIPNFTKNPLKTIRSIKKIAIQNNYDIVHANICLSSSAVYAFLIKLFSKNTKVYIHSHSASDKKKIRHHIIRPFLNKYSDQKIACSENAAKWMFGDKAFRKNDVKILNNFIDTKHFLYNAKTRNKIRKELNLEDKFVIGHVGRFVSVKNHQWLIDMFAQLSDKNDNYRLILIGTGELEDKIKSHAKTMGIEKKVQFLGTKSNINEYYQAMDLFVLPSLYEGLPIVCIEAQASGLKCLLADTVDKKADISGNVDFLPLDTPLLWQKKIRRIAKNGYRRANMQKTIIAAGYDLKKGVEEIEELYKKETKKERQ